MNNNLYTLKLTDKNGNFISQNKCASLRFVKDVYIPYASLECDFIIDSVSRLDSIGEVCTAEIYLGDSILHKGLIDTLDVFRKNNSSLISLKSKSFSSLLCQNQPEPGLMTNVNVGSVLALFPEIPFVSCSNSSTVNYIFIKDGSTLWDAVCCIAYRMNGSYPVIRGFGEIVIPPVNNTPHHVLGENMRLLESGVRRDFTKIISHIHMQDINGNYNVYSQSSPEAQALNIVRHKQVPLDKGFLNNPDSAPDYKLRFSRRGMKYRYFKYSGHNGEDLLDRVSAGDVSQGVIHRVEVTFDGVSPVTLIGLYNDGFFGG